jgi:protein tyrosine phosphatase (PTP) superfamily phosphohydrolase (DUF442 family)
VLTLRALRYGCLTGALLAGTVEAGQVLFGLNCHSVIPGQVYRCSQPSPDKLERLVRAHGIRTVINLRGGCFPNPLDPNPDPFYANECQVVQRDGLALEDVRLSAGRLPSVSEIRRLVEVLDRTEYPILIHCRRGADRTGLVAAITLLLRTDTDLAQGMHQLGVRYGHFALGRPANLDRFFDLYRAWLRQQGLEHSQAVFRRWLEHDYCPGECLCRIEPLDWPACLPCGVPAAVRVRCHNTSVRPWYFRPGSNGGIHALAILCDARDNFVGTERAGLLRAVVAPGQSIDLTMVLPAVRTPGRYQLQLDLVDEQHCSFVQAGSEPLEQELEFR